MHACRPLKKKKHTLSACFKSYVSVGLKYTSIISFSLSHTCYKIPKGTANLVQRRSFLPTRFLLLPSHLLTPPYEQETHSPIHMLLPYLSYPCEKPRVCAALKKRNRELEKKRLPRSQSVNRHIISIKVLVKEGRGNTDYAFHTYREKATGSLSHDKPQWQEAELKT